MTACATDGCGSEARSRGYCWSCYARRRRGEQPDRSARLESTHISFIKSWFEAAREGRELVLTIKGSGAEAAKARMQEIQAMNPSLFSQKS